jgi:multidrug efflux system outer membrane protein
MMAVTLPVLMSTACTTVGPNYKRPEVVLAQDYRAQIGAADAQSIADLPWWQVFNDKALHGLISQALTNNYDLQTAVARIEEARALVGVVKSQAKPQVGYEVTAGGQQVLLPERDNVDDFRYGAIGGVLNAAWEIDMWGRIRRQTEAAQANLMAEEEVRRGVMLTLVTDIAAGYFRLLRLDRQLAIAQESSAAYKDTLDLFTLRFEAGRDNRLPVERAGASYNASAARIADLKREIALQENALSVLTGGYPRAIERGVKLTEQTMPAMKPGLTTDLLRRRPDILQAEQVMIRANAEMGVAVADRYPRIGLSALLGAQALNGNHGIDGSLGVWNLLGNVAGPIFTGGRLESQYNARKAFWDQSVAQYRKTILTGFQETSNALVTQQTLAERRAALEVQIVALRNSVDLALLRYRSGRANYFEVLEAQQQLFPAEDALAETQQGQLVAVVSLYKALGGGWNVTPENWSKPPEVATR